MKHSLPLIDDSGDSTPAPPSIVSIGGKLISVVDTGIGRSTSEFVATLLEAGGARVSPSDDDQVAVRIVIRDTPRTAEARLRAEVIEANADVVLGSVRPVFGRLFASACARWVNS